MYRYTLGFIKKDHQILMLNREKNPWQGCWNGLGGKIEAGEEPMQSMIREIEEETGIVVRESQVIFKGSLTWNTFTAEGQGLYIFLIHMDPSIPFITPKKVREGILDWKDIAWINQMNNLGVAYNIPYFLPHVLNDIKLYHYHCTFNGNILESVEKKELT
jgi:8-oxo-dGTP diphosphatase